MSAGDLTFDVVIYGGTPGGIACAVRTAREGRTVQVVNQHQHLGGMLAAGLGLYDTNYMGFRAPLVEEIFDGILAHYARQDGIDSENYQLCRQNRTFESHVAETVLTRLLTAETNITIWKGYHVVNVVRSQRTLEAIGLRHFDTGEETQVRASIFVDASYEGDLAAVAGVPYRVGREARHEYGEPHAGKIFTRYEEQSQEHQKYPYEAAHGLINLKPFDVCTGRIFPGSTGEGDQAIMAYNYRLSLSRDPNNQAPIPKPETYQRENYLGLLLDEEESLGTPYPVKSGWLLKDIRAFQFRNHRQAPNQKISWNHGNFPGRNHAYPEGDWPQRRAILAAHRDHELGLLWFLQHDEAVPEEVRRRACALGLSKDEFVDNDHIPWEIYVREARRIKGRAIFTELDGSLAAGIQRTPPHVDSIAITEWMMDSHECTTERQPGSAYEGAVLLTEATRPAHIPYGCILPQGVDNLLVPGCLSATHIAFGAVRVEPTWIHIAESVGYACSLALRQGIAPALLDVALLQRTLVENGVMLAFFNDFDMASSERWVAAVQFFGCKGFFPSYEARATEPLDQATARLWIIGLGQYLQGILAPLSLAQKLKALPAQSGPTVSGKEFRQWLGLEIFLHLGIEQEALRLDQPQSEEPLTRGEACSLMYGLVQQLAAGPLTDQRRVGNNPAHT